MVTSELQPSSSAFLLSPWRPLISSLYQSTFDFIIVSGHIRLQFYSYSLLWGMIIHDFGIRLSCIELTCSPFHLGLHHKLIKSLRWGITARCLFTQITVAVLTVFRIAYFNEIKGKQHMKCTPHWWTSLFSIYMHIMKTTIRGTIGQFLIILIGVCMICLLWKPVNLKTSCLILLIYIFPSTVLWPEGCQFHLWWMTGPLKSALNSPMVSMQCSMQKTSWL